jgi:oxygen-independent coproporphyrinogen-3 oxidase
LPQVRETFAELEGQGLVAHEDGRYRPTESGWLLGNELYGALLELA